MGKFSSAKKLLGPVAKAVGYEAAWYLPAPARMAVETAESVATQSSAAHNAQQAQAAAQQAQAAAAEQVSALSASMPTPVPTPAATSRPTYYFDKSGAWLAYREGDHLFDAVSNGWIGWSPHQDDNFAAPDGTYLCSVWGAWLVRANAAPWADSAGQTVPVAAAVPQQPTAAVPPPVDAPDGFTWFERHLS